MEEVAQLLLLLLRVPRDVSGLAVKEVRHEDVVLVFFVGVGEDVGPLQILREEAEDVVDNEDRLFRLGGAGDVWTARSEEHSVRAWAKCRAH